MPGQPDLVHKYERTVVGNVTPVLRCSLIRFLLSNSAFRIIRSNIIRSDDSHRSNEVWIPPDGPGEHLRALGMVSKTGRNVESCLVAGVRVLIVDDMTLVRQGIQSLLSDQDSVEIVGEAADVQAAAELTAQLKPDVVLLDHDIPGLDTPEAVSLLKHHRTQVEVIVLSERADEEQAFRVLEAGASGYVLKDISADNLIRAINGVCNGRTVMHPYITRQLIERYRLLVRERPDRNNGNHMTGLTSRELEIIVEMAKGATDREIAQKASLAESTVKSHIRSILRKIGARNRTHAVAYVLRKGLMH